MNANETAAKVETYEIFSALTGRKIRTATQVTFTDGRRVRFMERMGKREAIRQAVQEIDRGAQA